MSKKPIYFQILNGLEVSVWKHKKEEDSSFVVKFIKHKRDAKLSRFFDTSDMETLCLLAQDVRYLFDVSKPQPLELDLDEM